MNCNKTVIQTCHDLVTSQKAKTDFNFLEPDMRSFLFAAPIILLAAACSSTPVTAPAPAPAAKPAPVVEAKPAVAAPAAKAPQCYNGETGNFDAVGVKATIAGVKVECKTTTDGKSAVWHGGK